MSADDIRDRLEYLSRWREPLRFKNWRRIAETVAMTIILGQRVRRTKLIQTLKYVVAVEVEMVIPEDDTSEPCYEAETVRFIQVIHEHAERDDINWLKRHGKVYTAVDAA